MGKKPSRVASREKWANLKTVTPMPHISIAVITPTHLTHTVLQWKKPLDCEEGMEKSYKKGQSEKTLANNREGLSLSDTHTFHRCLADCITFSQRQEPPDADQLWSVLKSP